MAIGKQGRGTGHLGGVLGEVQVPTWVLRPGGVPANVDIDFANNLVYGGTLASLVSCTRGSSATDLLYTDAAGTAYNTYGNNTLVVKSGAGVLIFSSRTNSLLNSTAPATQATASLGTGTYTLWVNGTGSAAVSAGTATITGAGTATNGTPVTFTVTVAGTVTVTVTGSLNAFQLENGAYPTSLIVTAGATASRSGDVVTLAGAALTIVQASTYSVAIQSSAATPNTFGQLIDVSNANTSSDIGIWRNSGNITFERNSVTQTLVYASPYHYATSAGASALQGAQNNALATAVSAAKVTVTKATLGINRTANASAAWSAPINRVALWNPALSNANTQTAST